MSDEDLKSAQKHRLATRNSLQKTGPSCRNQPHHPASLTPTNPHCNSHCQYHLSCGCPKPQTMHNSSILEKEFQDHTPTCLCLRTCRRETPSHPGLKPDPSTKIRQSEMHAAANPSTAEKRHLPRLFWPVGGGGLTACTDNQRDACMLAWLSRLSFFGFVFGGTGGKWVS